MRSIITRGKSVTRTAIAALALALALAGGLAGFWGSHVASTQAHAIAGTIQPMCGGISASCH